MLFVSLIDSTETLISKCKRFSVPWRDEKFSKKWQRRIPMSQWRQISRRIQKLPKRRFRHLLFVGRAVIVLLTFSKNGDSFSGN